jgi:putative tryptophan/tyrosine transport system substrate-binding protein
VKTNLEISSWRACLVLACAVLLAPAHAQQTEKFARIGFLSLADMPGAAQFGVAKALQGLGYTRGKNVAFEFGNAYWDSERLPEAAAELVGKKVDAIVALGNLSAFAAKQTTERVPILVWRMHAAVETGLVRSLARPGGNVTGVESIAPELDAKRLELIKEIVPKLTRLGHLYNPDDQAYQATLASVREAARKLGVRVVPLPVKRVDEIDGVLSGVSAGSIDALLTSTDEVTAWRAQQISAFGSKHRIPTVCSARYAVEAGCLLSYGPSLDEFSAVIAGQVDKVLKGAKVGDLPVEQVTRFEMLLNMKTAKALGITIPQSVRVRADELIE